MRKEFNAPKSKQVFDTKSTLAFCPICNQKVVTHVEMRPSKAAQTISIIICALGGVLGCCLVPFLIPDLNNAIHTCPHCGTVVGTNSNE